MKRNEREKKRFTTGRCRWFDLVDFERRSDRSQYINWVFIVGRLAAKYPSRVLTRPSIRRYSFFRFSVIERPLRTHALLPTIRRYTLFREQLVIFDISRVVVPKCVVVWRMKAIQACWTRRNALRTISWFVLLIATFYSILVLAINVDGALRFYG